MITRKRNQFTCLNSSRNVRLSNLCPFMYLKRLKYCYDDRVVASYLNVITDIRINVIIHFDNE